MTGFRFLFSLALFILINSCNNPSKETASEHTPETFVIVLGNIQDAGFPHIGCNRECCTFARNNNRSGLVSSIALVDKKSGSRYLFDATPDISRQLHMLDQWKPDTGKIIDGVFLTHAHIGHYTGLMYFGREALGADQIDVHVMPRMDSFIRNNGPWDQLITLKNIRLHRFPQKSALQLENKVSVEPLQVPHRDEYSETVGYLIHSGNRTLFYLPDIDKWNRWDQDILSWIRKCDYALIDGTFFQNGEIKNRDMSEIPHPFISETMDLLDTLPQEHKKKVYFIHFNHTNPVLDPNKDARKIILTRGYNVADEGLILSMD